MVFLESSFSGQPKRRKEVLHTMEGLNVEGAILGLPQGIQNEEVPYLPFRQAMQHVMEHQPSVLERSRSVKELRQMVAQLCTDTSEPVKFYTAIGTALDIYHSVDAFFEQGGKVATIDLSMRDKDHYKADVLVLAELDEEGKPYIRPESMRAAALRIAERLNGAASMH